MKPFLILFFLIISIFFRAQKTERVYIKTDPLKQKYGLSSSSGQWIVTPEFDYLQQLNPYFYYGENKQIGNYNYRYDVDSKKLERINYQLFDKKLYDNKFVIIESYLEGPKGIMDIFGKEILPTFYNSIQIKEDYFICELENQFSLYNKRGEKILKDSFSYIDVFNGFIYVSIPDKRFPNEQRIVVYNPDLKEITQEDWTIEGRLGKDRLLFVKTIKGDKFYCDEQGSIVIPSVENINYEDAFSNGYAIVSTPEEPKKYGFINTNGELAIPMIYDEVAPYQQHYAFFSKKDNEKYVQGLIDHNDNMIKIFPAKVISRSIYYDGNEMTYYLSNLETYDADGNLKKDNNLIR